MKYRIARERMLQEQLIKRGITDSLVLEAMAKVPRHEFVPEALVHSAYDDRPLPIGYGQTISQPYVVALMLQSLEAQKGMTVLEVGTGSGYQAALLHAMGLYVFSVERLQELYFSTKKLFERLKLNTIRISLSDGTMGWKEMSPFNRIIVAAGGPVIPDPLLEQLEDKGIMLVPVGGEKHSQELVRVSREGNQFFQTSLTNVAFVDLVGEKGW